MHATEKLSLTYLLTLLVLAVVVLLVLILKFRVQAFLALILASLFVAMGLSSELTGGAGMLELTQIGDQIKNAMGGSLGFIATIIGLGAIFGAMLEHSGGAQSLAKSLLKIFGQKRASWAMVVTVRFCSYHVELSPTSCSVGPAVKSAILALGVFAFCTERTINASR